jgi:hypothetical protein
MSLALELDESRRLALELGQCAAAISATMGKARLLGMLVEKREVGAPGAFTKAEALDDIERKHGREVRDMLARALGDVGSSAGELPTPNEKA